MMKVTILSCLLVALHHECSAQVCLRPANTEDSINFEDQGGSAPRIANGNGAQAIVTGYQFHCCGDIAEWGAYVRPNGRKHQGGAYSINFQVWRPSPTVGSDGAGVYSLVGENRFTSIAFPPGDPVRVTPQPTDVISVRPGDVVGFFQSSIEGPNDGIQLEDTSFSYEHLLWYQTAFSQGSLSTLVVGTAGTLISSTNAGIQLTAGISSSSCTPLPTPLPTPPTTAPPTTRAPSTTAPPTTGAPPNTAPPPPPTRETEAPPTEGLFITPPLTEDMLQQTPSTETEHTSQSLTAETTEPSREDSGQDGGAVNDHTFSNTTPENNPVNAGLAAGLVVVSLVVIASFTIIVVLVVSRKHNQGSLGHLNSTYLFKKVSIFKKPIDEPSINNTDQNNYSTVVYESYNANIENSSQHYYSLMGASTSEERTVPTASLRTRNTSNGKQSSDIELSEMTNSNYSFMGPEYSEASQCKMEEFQSALYTNSRAAGYAYDYKETHGISVPALASAGNVVPNQSDRELLSESEKKLTYYSKLDFFTEDHVYWTPGNSASELYNQLASKNYREILRNDIKILGHLGSGQFGTVSKGLWSVPKASLTIAVKQTLKTASSVERVKLLQEAAIMGQFSHPYVIKLYGLVTINDPLMICIEYMEKGDLKSYLKSMDITSPHKEAIGGFKDVRYFFLKALCEIAAGMRYLAGKGFIHRDLAARNIFLTGSLTCKIGDFGMARDLTDDMYYKAQKGNKIPVKWTAPEALLFKKYSSDSDVWSYAMVLFEIWSVGEHPFSTMSNMDVIKVLEKGYCQPPPPGCPRAIYKLMVDCWNPQHHLRPKFAEICNYLQQPVSKLLYWPPHDSKLPPSVGVIGAPLNSAFKLYLELQEHYVKPDCKYY